MIHPSYVELMKIVNDSVDVGEEPVVNSRYSIVCATAKRARQIIDYENNLKAEELAEEEAANAAKESKGEKDKDKDAKPAPVRRQKKFALAPLVKCSPNDKPLSIAVKEMEERQLIILTDEEAAARQAEVEKAEKIMKERREEAMRLAKESAEAEAAEAEDIEDEDIDVDQPDDEGNDPSDGE